MRRSKLLLAAEMTHALPSQVRAPTGADAACSPEAARRERTQRQRILDSVIELSVRAAPPHLSVAQVCSHAGVSTATFYELFGDTEEALVAAFFAAVERVFEGLQLRVGDRGWPVAVRSALEVLLDRLSNDPAAGWMVGIQARGCGPRVRQALERTLEAFEQRTEALMACPPIDGGTLDIPASALIGGLRSILCRSLRSRREDLLPSLGEDVFAWISSYHVPAGRQRWSTGPHAQMRGIEPVSALALPGRLPHGRQGLAPGFVARTQRTHVIHATAVVMLAKGYTQATVADVLAHAAVSREVFYEHFASKQDAFDGAQRYGIQHVLQACTDAYLKAAEWPERVWHALEALVQAIARAPALSHLSLLGCYEAGPEGVRRIEDTARSFAIFLREGEGYAPNARRLGAVACEAVTGAILEIVQRQLARGDSAALPTLLPQLAYIALTPFIGPRDAASTASALAASEPSNP